MNGNKVGILLVVRNEEYNLNIFLSNIKDQSHSNIVIYLYDNNSDDKSLLIAKESSLNIIIIESKINNGFALPNNILAKKAFEDGCDYIFVLNPDLLLAKDCIELLIKYHNNNKEIGAFAPIMLNENTEIVNSCGTYVNFSTYKERWPYRGKIFNAEIPDILIVDTIGGGVTFMPKSTYIRVGLFEPFYFIYGEEIDLGLRLRNEKIKVAVITKTYIRRFNYVRKESTYVDNFRIYYKNRSIFLFLLKNMFLKGVVLNIFASILRFPFVIKHSYKNSNIKYTLFYYRGVIDGLIKIGLRRDYKF